MAEAGHEGPGPPGAPARRRGQSSAPFGRKMEAAGDIEKAIRYANHKRQLYTPRKETREII